MSNFRYKTPDDFKKNEEKWFKYFTLPSLFITIIFSIIGGLIFIPILTAMHLFFTGVLLTAISGGIGYGISTFYIPIESQIPGNGLKPITVIFRIILRRLPRNRRIYVKNYGKYENYQLDDEGRKE